MILDGERIRQLGLVEGFVLNEQFQPAGVDLTAQSLWAYDGEGVIDADNKKRKIPAAKKLEWGADGSVRLWPGAYKIIFNETVSIPKDCAAFARSRSSLLRMGASVQTALWDPGYTGRSEALLYVFNPAGIVVHANARLVQLVFARLERAAGAGYCGQYQGENLGGKEGDRLEKG